MSRNQPHPATGPRLQWTILKSSFNAARIASWSRRKRRVPPTVQLRKRWCAAPPRLAAMILVPADREKNTKNATALRPDGKRFRKRKEKGRGFLSPAEFIF